jgi:hypothetical protein
MQLSFLSSKSMRWELLFNINPYSIVDFCFIRLDLQSTSMYPSIQIALMFLPYLIEEFFINIVYLRMQQAALR